eukprot:68504-Chlamydomonas_euryale.AAC.2
MDNIKWFQGYDQHEGESTGMRTIRGPTVLPAAAQVERVNTRGGEGGVWGGGGRLRRQARKERVSMMAPGVLRVVFRVSMMAPGC